MRNYILLFSIVLILVSCKEKKGSYDPIDSSTFVKMYGKSQIDEGFDFKQTEDEGFILVGSAMDHYNSKTGVEGDKQIYIVKVDKYGNKEWELSIGDSSVNDTINKILVPLDDEARSVQITSDGNYIIAGTQMLYTYDLFLGVNTYTNMFLMKLDKQGKVLFQNNQIGFDNVDDRGNGVLELFDGNFVIFGSTKNGSGNNAAGVRDGIIVTCNSNLEIIEDTLKQNGFNTNEEYLKGIRLDDSRIVMLGEQLSLSGEGSNIWLAPFKYSTSGFDNILYETKFNESFNDFSGDFILHENKVIMVGTDGILNGSNSWVSSYEIGDQLVPSGINVSISNPDGYMYGNSICVSNDNDGFIVLNTLETAGDQNIALSFIDFQGIIDAEKFNVNFGDVGVDEGVKIIPTLDGGYAILGNTKFGTDQKLVLIKLDANGGLK